MKRALVLSGGGAKGSYQLGVYKALKKLGIKIDIITGTSIGSINGALLVTGDYKKAKKLWLTIKSDTIFNYTFENPKEYPKIVKELVTNKGLNIEKGEEFISKIIDEEKIRKSKIDYGLVTVNLKTKVPKMLTKEAIPKGKLISYIIASATCFPAIQLKEIDGENYIDGGYYDNLPINLAIDMGADEVIAVDLSAIGIKQKVKNSDVKIDYIKHSDKHMFTLDFNPTTAKKNIKLGYNDTMKYYKKLEGNIYTFKKGDIERNYNKISNNYISLFKQILSNEKDTLLTEIFKNQRYKNILSNIKQNKKIDVEINKSLEYLGTIFDLDEQKVYNIDVFNRKLIREAKNLSYLTLDKNLKGKMLIGYIYNKYMNSEDKQEVHKKLLNIALIFQKDFLAAVYLIAISQKYLFTLYSDKLYNSLSKN